MQSSTHAVSAPEIRGTSTTPALAHTHTRTTHKEDTPRGLALKPMSRRLPPNRYERASEQPARASPWPST
eukprot:1671551-Prymnesium_polylepis.1